MATKLDKKFPLHVQNLHMSYDAEEGIDGIRRITFLYKLVSGIATGNKELAIWRAGGSWPFFLQNPSALNAAVWHVYQKRYSL